MNNGVESRGEISTSPTVIRVRSGESGPGVLYLFPLGQQHPNTRVDLAYLVDVGYDVGFDARKLTERFRDHGLGDAVLTDEAISIARQSYGEHAGELEALVVTRGKDMVNTVRQLAQLLGLTPQRSRT